MLLPISSFVGYGMGYGLDYLFHTTWIRYVVLVLGTISGLVELIRELSEDAPVKMPFDFDRAIARVPKWMLAVAAIGVAVAARMGGSAYAGPFLVGAAASYFNFRLIEKAVNKLGDAAKQP